MVAYGVEKSLNAVWFVRGDNLTTLIHDLVETTESPRNEEFRILRDKILQQHPEDIKARGGLNHIYEVLLTYRASIGEFLDGIEIDDDGELDDEHDRLQGDEIDVDLSEFRALRGD